MAEAECWGGHLLVRVLEDLAPADGDGQHLLAVFAHHRAPLGAHVLLGGAHSNLPAQRKSAETREERGAEVSDGERRGEQTKSSNCPGPSFVRLLSGGGGIERVTRAGFGLSSGRIGRKATIGSFLMVAKSDGTPAGHSQMGTTTARKMVHPNVEKVARHARSGYKEHLQDLFIACG